MHFLAARSTESSAHHRLLSKNRRDARTHVWISRHGLVSESIVVIKLVHTAIFLTLLGCVLHVTWAGLRGRATSATVVALVAIVLETLVFAGNGRRCPLTVIVEDLGAAHGQVSASSFPAGSPNGSSRFRSRY